MRYQCKLVTLVYFAKLFCNKTSLLHNSVNTLQSSVISCTCRTVAIPTINIIGDPNKHGGAQSYNSTETLYNMGELILMNFTQF